MSEKRAVCLNCIDGRAQLPVIDWAKQEYQVDYVDMITEPGIVGLIADENASLADILNKINLSIKVNHSRVLIVAAHFDCKGNPVSEDEQKQQIKQAVNRLKEKINNIPVIGLWINSDFKGEGV